MKLNKTPSKFKSFYERNLIHDIIQPVGVTNKPQEKQLKNFVEKAKNF